MDDPEKSGYYPPVRLPLIEDHHPVDTSDPYDWALRIIIGACVLWCIFALCGCWDSRTETATQTKAATHRTEVVTKQIPVSTPSGIQVVPVKEVREITEDQDGTEQQSEHTTATVTVPPALGAVASAMIPGAGAVIAAASSPAQSDGFGGLLQGGLALLAATGSTAAVVKHQQAKRSQEDADDAWADAQHYAHHAPPGTPPPPSMA